MLEELQIKESKAATPTSFKKQQVKDASTT